MLRSAIIYEFMAPGRRFFSDTLKVNKSKLLCRAVVLDDTNMRAHRNSKRNLKRHMPAIVGFAVMM